MEHAQTHRSAEIDGMNLDALASPGRVDAGPIGGNFETRMTFGRLAIIPGARVLLRDGEPVELGSRAYDLLVVLLNARGAVVSKREIMKHVWPSTVVEDSNLRFQISSLRRALGEQRDFIKTIPGRGYLLAAEFNVAQNGPSTGVEAETPVERLGLLSNGMVGDHECSSDPGSDSRRPTVAIVDDDGSTREALHALIRSIGLRAESFSSVAAFLGRARPSHPECLILDVWLPGQTGLELQTELRETGSKFPVIFISGHADVHTCVRAMKGGAFDFLTKPVRHQELIETIRLAIAPERGDMMPS